MGSMHGDHKIVVVEVRYGLSVTSCDDRLGLAKLGLNLATRDVMLNTEQREKMFKQLREHLEGLYVEFEEET